jgi:hypothetical protein
MIQFRQPGVSYSKTYTNNKFLSDLASWIKDSRQSHTCAHITRVCYMAQAARSTGVCCMPTLTPPPVHKSVSTFVNATRHNWIRPTQHVCPVLAHTLCTCPGLTFQQWHNHIHILAVVAPMHHHWRGPQGTQSLHGSQHAYAVVCTQLTLQQRHTTNG